MNISTNIANNHKEFQGNSPDKEVKKSFLQNYGQHSKPLHPHQRFRCYRMSEEEHEWCGRLLLSRNRRRWWLNTHEKQTSNERCALGIATKAAELVRDLVPRITSCRYQWSRASGLSIALINRMILLITADDDKIQNAVLKFKPFVFIHELVLSCIEISRTVK